MAVMRMMVWCSLTSAFLSIVYIVSALRMYNEMPRKTNFCIFIMLSVYRLVSQKLHCKCLEFFFNVILLQAVNYVVN